MGNLRSEEQLGLAVAVALHVALIGLFVLRPSVTPTPLPQRISVTLSPEVGPNAAAPTHEDAAADVAPTLGAPPAPQLVVSPPSAKVEMPPVVKPAPALKPVAVTPPPEPAPLSPAKLPHKPKLSGKHSPSVEDWNLASPTTADRQPAGASRIGNDFLKGVAGGKVNGKARQQGAAAIGPEVKSALSGAIAHQLKPHWTAPQGVDADRLVTILAWDLNPDGSLAGAPRVVRQEGITDSNRPQAARHAEQAIRAVQLAAPFQLPPEYYALWKHVGSSRFDRTLSQ